MNWLHCAHCLKTSVEICLQHKPPKHKTCFTTWRQGRCVSHDSNRNIQTVSKWGLSWTLWHVVWVHLSGLSGLTRKYILKYSNVKTRWKILIIISQSAQSDVFMLLLLSNQQLKIQRLFIYNHKWQRKAANSSFKKLEPANEIVSLLLKLLARNLLSVD